MVRGGAIAQPFPADGQIAVVRPYAKKVMFRSEYRISFSIFDETAQTYADKFFAFAGPLLTAELHMGNGHRVRFNSDPKYPQIVERIEAVLLPHPPSQKTKIPHPSFP